MKKRNLMIAAATATVLLIGGTMVYAAPRNTANPSTPTSSTNESIINENSSISLLTNAEAEAIALKHAGLTADQVTRLKSEYDWDDRIKHFDIEFRSGDYEFDYEVNAETGAVLSWDKDYEKSNKSASNTTTKTESKSETTTDSKAETNSEAKAECKTEAKAETKSESKAEDKAETKPESKTEDKAETKPAASALLTNAEAEAIALEHAGLTADQVTRLKSEYDVDDGIKQYDIDFRSGNYEYEYEINAESGVIISWDKEFDD